MDLRIKKEVDCLFSEKLSCGWRKIQIRLLQVHATGEEDGQTCDVGSECLSRKIEESYCVTTVGGYKVQIRTQTARHKNTHHLDTEILGYEAVVIH